MPGRTNLHRMILAGLLAGALAAATPARAEGFVQSLFNSGGNNASAKPLFLKGSNASSGATGRVFDINGDSSDSGDRPSVAGTGQSTQARNDAAIKADVARSAQKAADRLAQMKEANQKVEAARLAATEEQRRQTIASQAANASAAKAAANQAAAATPVPGSMSAPTAVEDAPLYVTPGQANTGQAPIFGIH